jgi:hypothetical protein
VDIRVRTWIQRGDHVLTIENVPGRDQINPQTFRMPGDPPVHQPVE